MREQRVLAFYAELRGGKATWWVNLLNVNEDLEGKHNTESFCKRVKHKVYFVILQRVKQNLGNQTHFLVILIRLCTYSDIPVERTRHLPVFQESSRPYRANKPCHHRE